MTQPAANPKAWAPVPTGARTLGREPAPAGPQHGPSQAAVEADSGAREAGPNGGALGPESALWARQADLLQRLGETLLELSELARNQLDEAGNLGLMDAVPTAPPKPIDPPQERSSDRLLSVADLAEKLGVHERTVRRMRQRGELPPAVDLGSVLRWRPDVVDSWLAERQEAGR